MPQSLSQILHHSHGSSLPRLPWDLVKIHWIMGPVNQLKRGSIWLCVASPRPHQLFASAHWCAGAWFIGQWRGKSWVGGTVWEERGEEGGEQGIASAVLMTCETDLGPWQWGCLGTKSWCTSLIRYSGMWDRVELRNIGCASTGHGRCCSGEEVGHSWVGAPNDWLPWGWPWSHWYFLGGLLGEEVMRNLCGQWTGGAETQGNLGGYNCNWWAGLWAHPKPFGGSVRKHYGHSESSLVFLIGIYVYSLNFKCRLNKNLNIMLAE